MSPLKNAKHEAFARAIVEGKSGREAYKSAGYAASDASADANASRLLKTAKVAARVAELKAAAAERSVVSATAVIEELAKIGFANMQDFIAVGANGDPYVDLSELTRDQAAAIGEVTVEDYKDGRGEDARDVRRVRFRLHDKRAALVDLGKHLGIFKDTKSIELTGKNGGAIALETTAMSDLELARRLAFYLTKGAREAPPKRKG